MARASASTGPASGRAKRDARKEANKAANKGATSLNLADKKVWYGLGFLTLFGALAIFQFFTLVGDMVNAPRGMGNLDVGDHSPANVELMKEVFFSGNPYALFCVDEKSDGAPVPPLVSDIVKEMNADTEVEGAMLYQANCFKALPTGQTIAERFNFGKNPNFIAVFGDTEKPLQLNYLTNAKAVYKLMKPVWLVSQSAGMKGSGITKVTYLKDFDKFKTRGKSIVLMGKTGDQRKAMSQMLGAQMKNHRDLKAFMIDSSFYHLGLDKDFVDLAPKDEAEAFGEAVCFVKSSHSSKLDALGEEMPQPKSDLPEAKKTTYKAAYLPSWDGEAISAFLAECSAGENSYEEDVKKFHALVRKPWLAAIPSETKHVKAPARPGAKGGDDGKERVGRRQEESEDELDDELDEEIKEEEEQVEDVDL